MIPVELIPLYQWHYRRMKLIAAFLGVYAGVFIGFVVSLPLK